MIMRKAGNVKILNNIVCPHCGAIYDDVRPTDIYWSIDHTVSFYAIKCQCCGEEIEVKKYV